MPPPPAGLSDRLAVLVREGAKLEAEGLPFPTEQLKAGVTAALAASQTEQAATLLKRGESLLAVATRDWSWVRDLLQRADELRQLAVSIGVDLQVLDARVGSPREQLKSQTLSAASLGRAGASASLAVAVLHDTIPKYCVAEAQKLGESIRLARNRGEDVTEAVRRFSLLLQAIQDEHLVATANRLIEARKAVARIPRAPAITNLPSEEEEEILLEARNLARRLSKMKSRARNAQAAARLMTEVRAALSEERRFGTPEEEIEALWNEVGRLTQERRAASPIDPTELPPAGAGEIAAPEEELDYPGAAEGAEEFPTSSRGRGRRTPPPEIL